MTIAGIFVEAARFWTLLMGKLLENMIALEDAVRRVIPRLASDPVLLKCEFNLSSIVLHDVEFLEKTGRQVVVLESCGPLSDYVAEVLRELLLEENFDAYVTFQY